MYRCNRHFRPVLVLVSAAVCGVIADDLSGQCELAKLLADDGAANDRFGISVAISDMTCLPHPRRLDSPVRAHVLWPTHEVMYGT